MEYASGFEENISRILHRAHDHLPFCNSLLHMWSCDPIDEWATQTPITELPENSTLPSWFNMDSGVTIMKSDTTKKINFISEAEKLIQNLNGSDNLMFWNTGAPCRMSNGRSKLETKPVILIRKSHVEKYMIPSFLSDRKNYVDVFLPSYNCHPNVVCKDIGSLFLDFDISYNLEFFGNPFEIDHKLSVVIESVMTIILMEVLGQDYERIRWGFLRPLKMRREFEKTERNEKYEVGRTGVHLYSSLITSKKNINAIFEIIFWCFREENILTMLFNSEQVEKFQKFEGIGRIFSCKVDNTLSVGLRVPNSYAVKKLDDKTKVYHGGYYCMDTSLMEETYAQRWRDVFSMGFLDEAPLDIQLPDFLETRLRQNYISNCSSSGTYEFKREDLKESDLNFISKVESEYKLNLERLGIENHQDFMKINWETFVSLSHGTNCFIVKFFPSTPCIFMRPDKNALYVHKESGNINYLYIEIRPVDILISLKCYCPKCKGFTSEMISKNDTNFLSKRKFVMDDMKMRSILSTDKTHMKIDCRLQMFLPRTDIRVPLFEHFSDEQTNSKKEGTFREKNTIISGKLLRDTTSSPPPSKKPRNKKSTFF